MPEKPKIVIVSDCQDVAFNEMRQIILNECVKLGCKNVNIEPLVPVIEFSVLNAAFLTRLLSDHYPPGTIFSIVINPQKHRSPRIYGKTKKGHYFFGANTGALTWFLKDSGVEELYEINDPGFISFGGKYVHAPGVAKIAAGIPFEKFGKKFKEENLAKLDYSEGTVVHIDNFGLIKIVGGELPYSEGQKFKIKINGKERITAIFSKRMMSNEDNEWVLYSGSSLNSMPELGKVRNKEGYKELGVEIGDKITWVPVENNDKE